MSTHTNLDPMPSRSPPPSASSPGADSSTPPEDGLLQALNSPQREAVTHVDGPLLVIAGPGSGKTRVITHRIAHLIRQGVPPDAILAITFTNKAAGEMRQRILDLLGLATRWISTFHSFAARLLRRHIYRLEPFTTDFSIYDTDDSITLLKACLKELDIPSSELTPRQALGGISRLKNAGLDDPDARPPGLSLREERIRRVYPAYVRALQENNALDFDDLLNFLDRLLATQPDILEDYQAQFRYVLIDEFQDTNAIQYRIGKRIAQAHRNLCVTGDPDQSIYSWRGADITNILSFEADFEDARVIKLEQNYRSTKSILCAAQNLIEHNVERKEKELWTENAGGDPVRLQRYSSGESEALGIATAVRELLEEGRRARDIAVFYRINALSRELERAFVVRDIPYVIVGATEFYQRKEIKDLLAYLRLWANPRDGESLRRIINVPPRRIGARTSEKIFQAASEADVAPLTVILDPKLRSRAVSGKAHEHVSDFARLWSELPGLEGASVLDLLRSIIESVDYESYLRGLEPESWEERVENIAELGNAAAQYDRDYPDGSVTGFLEQASLLAAVDRWDPEVDRVSLMTYHSAKGLEFPIVFLAATEQGLVPLERSSGDSDIDVEEERRLFYVGITRARENLVITHAATRQRFGHATPTMPSDFLPEIAGADDATHLEVDPETAHVIGRRSGSSLEDEPDPELRGRRPGGIDFDFDADVVDDDDGEAEPFSVDDWDDEIVDEDPFPVGARVLHEEYGEGTVIRSSGLGRGRHLHIEFEGFGRKSIRSHYAPLRRL